MCLIDYDLQLIIYNWFPLTVDLEKRRQLILEKRRMLHLQSFSFFSSVSYYQKTFFVHYNDCIQYPDTDFHIIFSVY